MFSNFSELREFGIFGTNSALYPRKLRENCEKLWKTVNKIVEKCGILWNIMEHYEEL